LLNDERKTDGEHSSRVAATLPARLAGPIHAIAARTRANLDADACRWPGLGEANLLTTRPADAESGRAS
jgi:hypothetical protein